MALATQHPQARGKRLQAVVHVQLGFEVVPKIDDRHGQLAQEHIAGSIGRRHRFDIAVAAWRRKIR